MNNSQKKKDSSTINQNDKSHITIFQHCNCEKKLTKHTFVDNKLICNQCKK
jgi:hypothetical protein